MTTDVAHTHSTDLTITPDQTAFTPTQVAALEHMGVKGAPDEDLAVFFNHVARTGLDPFLKQIYMIGRKTRVNVGGRWEDAVKYTIQTGIDGYRVIGHRAARETGTKVAVSAPEWMHPSGKWLGAWSKAWGYPVAARVTISRDGERFEAVANFDEYAQTKGRDGGLNSMWEQRPAGQIAKCAESLAWRLAFPHDLNGIYTTDEMGQADNRGETTVSGNTGAAPQAPAAAGRADAPDGRAAHEDHTAAEAHQPADDGVLDAEVVDEPAQDAGAAPAGFNPEAARASVWESADGCRRLAAWVRGQVPNPTPDQIAYVESLDARAAALDPR